MFVCFNLKEHFQKEKFQENKEIFCKEEMFSKKNIYIFGK